jgi:hypothetical protein
MLNHIPKVSVGLPVYNGENHLASALDSLLKQTFVDFEMVISDNASTDRTEQICRQYAACDSRIRYYRAADNHGIAWNFNRTFELARGEYFRWHAHDDVCAPTLLARCVAQLDADPAAVLSYARTKVIDYRGEPLPQDPANWRPPVAQSGGDEAAGGRDIRGLDSPHPHRRYSGVLLQTVWCLESYGLMRSSAVRTTGKLRPYCGAEKVFLAEMALRGKMLEVPATLFLPRRHSAQYTMLATGSAQQCSVKPLWKKARLPIPRQVRSTFGYLGLIPQAPISFFSRCRCLTVLLRYVFQVSKWKRIAVNTLADENITDGYLQVQEGTKRPLPGTHMPSAPAMKMGSK